MRKLVALILVALPVALAVASGAAASPPGPGTVPVQPKLPPTAHPKLDLPARIMSVKPTPARGVAVAVKPIYSEGPLSYDVEIASGNSTPLATNLIVERVEASPTVVAKVAVNAGPSERTTVTFQDDASLKTGCGSTEYRLKLESGGSARVLRVKPTCAFSAEAIDPLASVPTDTRLTQRQGKISYHAPTYSPAPTPICGTALEMKATVRNGTATNANDVRLKIEAPGNDAQSAMFDLGAGKETKATVQLSFLGLPGNYTLKLEGGGAPTYQPGWHLKVMRACTIDLDLD